MKNKVVFLDRDGTINVDFGFVHEVEKLEFTEGAITGLKKLYDAGYKLIIVTNQSGIGRSYYSENDFKIFNNYLETELKKYGIIIEKTYYCPHVSSDNCNCRKPKLALFEKAIFEYNVDLKNSYVIGDRKRDLIISDSTPITPIMVFNSSKEYISKKNLLEAADYILKNK